MNHGGKRSGAGRPKGQGKYGTSTKAIRVPEHLIDDVKNYSINGGYRIPLFSSSVEAGYPSLAEDHIEDMLDMNSLLIDNPKTTFCVRVSGLSMIDAGIYEGDLLVVDSSITEIEGKIVVACLDGMVTVKKFSYINKKPYLVPENPDFKIIPISNNAEIKIFGVVTKVIRSL